MGKIRNDIILIIVVVALIVSLFVWWFVARMDDANELYVNIYYDETLLYSTPLKEDNEYVVKGKVGDVHIIIEDGYVCVSEAECPNHLCVGEGKKNHNNDTITCLPNLVYIKIGGHIDV